MHTRTRTNNFLSLFRAIELPALPAGQKGVGLQLAEGAIARHPTPPRVCWPTSPLHANFANKCRLQSQGHYCVNGTQTECPRGTYQPYTGMSTCYVCGPETECFRGGCTECTPCKGGGPSHIPSVLQTCCLWENTSPLSQLLTQLNALQARWGITMMDTHNAQASGELVLSRVL